MEIREDRIQKDFRLILIGVYILILALIANMVFSLWQVNRNYKTIQVSLNDITTSLTNLELIDEN